MDKIVKGQKSIETRKIDCGPLFYKAPGFWMVEHQLVFL